MDRPVDISSMQRWGAAGVAARAQLLGMQVHPARQRIQSAAQSQRQRGDAVFDPGRHFGVDRAGHQGALLEGAQCSVSARISLAQSSAYAASKAGLLSPARTLSDELIGRGIRVNGLSPGPTETAALGKLGLPPEEEQALRQAIRQRVLNERLGTPWELAQAAVFLVSDGSRFVVGTVLLMDGGAANI